MRGQGRLIPPDPRRRGRIRRGFDVTLGELRRSDRVGLVDEAVVALCRVMADELDAACHDEQESRFTRAAIAGRYRDVLGMFLEGASGDDGDDVDRMLAELLDAADARPAD